MPWDFNVPAKRDKALAKIRKEKPLLLIGSPMCTAFSQLQNLSRDKGNVEQNKLSLANGIKHIRFCIQLYWDQHKHGRYFLHEHPNAATRGQLPEMVQLLMHPDVIRTKGDMCAHGMASKDKHGSGLVQKPTGWATNSPHIAEQVSAQCSNRWRGAQHRHVHLVSARAKAAEVYPPKLCIAIPQGLRRQLIADGLMTSNDAGTVCCEEPDIGDDIKEEIWGQQLL